MFKGEGQKMKIRPSSAKKYDYDQLYISNEQKYEVKMLKIRVWGLVENGETSVPK